MKTNLTIISTILAGSLSLLNAQSSPLMVKLYSTDSTSSANGPATSVMFFSFSGDGKDSLDMYDMGNLSSITTGRDYCSPFSTSAENEVITQFDSRYFFTAPRTVPFGMYSQNAATISLSALSLGASSNLNDSIWNEEIGNIYVEDLGTNMMYDIFGDTAALSIPANSTTETAYQLHFFPALRVTTVNESCSGSGDGSMHITNPGTSNWILLINGPNGMVSMPVMNSDTLLDMLQPGAYAMAAFTNGILTDNQTINVGSHSLAIPSFTPSTNVEGQGINIDFTNTTPNLYAWSWNMGDGNYYATQDATHAYATAGTYSVSLTATDSAGCQGSITQTIQITLLPPTTPPSFFNSDTLNHSYEAGMKNPTVATREGNTLVITQQEEATTLTQVNVYAIGGSLVASQNATSTVTEIQLPKSGCYIVMMVLSNGEIKSQQVVLGM